MRTKQLFINADGSIQNISDILTIDCGQDMRFLIVFTASGLDGNPIIHVEQTLDSVTWVPVFEGYDCPLIIKLSNTSGDLGFGIQDDEFMGASLRVRVEPNDNTQGQYSAKIGYKTKV